MELNKEEFLLLYRRLILTRAFEEKVVELFAAGKIQEHPHSGLGMEAVGIGALTFLRQDDYAIPTHRGYSKQIGKGVSLKKMLAEFYGKNDGYGKGKDSHHLTAKEVNVIGKWGLIGAQFTIAVGLGISAQAKGQGQICAIFFGDGSSNRGTFHEALNLSSLWKLPILWLCENNRYSATTPIEGHTAAENIADYAKSYRIPGITIDGNDVIAVHEAVQKAAERARRGEGPSLIELTTYRIRSHNERSKEIRPQSEIDEWKKKDPVLTFRRQLIEKGILREGDVEKIAKDVETEIEEAVRFAEQSSPPEPKVAFEDLFVEK
jgi:pyruvate dehydrogenase E1 component alpha subunit